jgi:hypothetical protein
MKCRPWLSAHRRIVLSGNRYHPNLQTRHFSSTSHQALRCQYAHQPSSLSGHLTFQSCPGSLSSNRTTNLGFHAAIQTSDYGKTRQFSQRLSPVPVYKAPSSRPWAPLGSPFCNYFSFPGLGSRVVFLTSNCLVEFQGATNASWQDSIQRVFTIQQTLRFCQYIGIDPQAPCPASKPHFLSTFQ